MSFQAIFLRIVTLARSLFFGPLAEFGYTDLMISANMSGFRRSLKRNENSFKYKGKYSLLTL